MQPEVKISSDEATSTTNDEIFLSAADLEAGYRSMAENAEREAEALEWIESLINDSAER